MLKSATPGEPSQWLCRCEHPSDMIRWLRCRANRQNKGLFCPKQPVMMSSGIFGIQFFKLIGRHVIAVTVNANGVVESLYVLKNEPVGVVVILNAKPVQPLTLDKRMEGFDARIVVWVAFVAVAEIEFFGSFPICFGNVLTASIGMENERQVGISTEFSLVYGVDNAGYFHVVGERPCNDFA